VDSLGTTAAPHVLPAPTTFELPTATQQLLRIHCQPPFTPPDDVAVPVSDDILASPDALIPDPIDPIATLPLSSDGLQTVPLLPVDCSVAPAPTLATAWPSVSAPGFLSGTASPSTDSDVLSSFGLPARNKVLDVVDLFFLNFHAHIPCLQETTFRATYYRDGVFREDSALLFAVLAIAARLHTDPLIQAQEQEWYDHAKTLYSQTVKAGITSVEPIQTACLIAFQGLIIGDLEAVWTVLGDAWRKACALGLNRLDAPDLLDPRPLLKLKSPKEKEEHRMVFWTLFLLDRLTSFPCGLPYAIDDRYVLVNLPLQLPAFVNSAFATPEPEPAVPFTRNLHSLVLAKPANSYTPVPIIHHIVKAYVLLGRIVEHVYALHPATDPGDIEAAELDNALIYFRLNLPRSATHLSSAALSDLKHVVWLNIIMHANTILLHFWQYSSQSQSKSFDSCVVAASAIVSIVKEACRIDPSLLVNMHLLPAFYLSSRILLIHGRGCLASSSSSPSKFPDSEVLLNQNWRSDMNLLLMVFRMVGETYKALGVKFEEGVRQDLELNEEGVQRIFEAGARGLLLHCCSWRRGEVL
jgi:hypothetical protein